MTRLEKLEQHVGDALARQWGALQSATVNDIPVLAQYIAGQLDNGTEQALAIEMAHDQYVEQALFKPGLHIQPYLQALLEGGGHRRGQAQPASYLLRFLIKVSSDFTGELVHYSDIL